MDYVTIFFVKISQPLILFFDKFFSLVLRIDRWWSKKSDYTKLNIRWTLFFAGFVVLLIIRENKKENEQIVADNRNAVFVNSLLKGNKECEEWKIKYLEKDIERLEKIQNIALENEKEIKILIAKK